MEIILAYLIEHASFLYREYKCRFVDSVFSQAYGGDSIVVLESPGLRLRILTERKVLSCDFQALHKRDELDWYSLDLFRKIFLSEPEFHGGLESENTRFLREYFHLIEQVLSEENYPDTYEKLEAVTRLRVKQLFGFEYQGRPPAS